MSEFDVTEPFRTLFYASVGAVATTADKTREVVNDLVAKGELTVEQGKTLNEELSRKAKEVMDDTSDAALRTKLQTMSPEEREAYAAKVAKMSADLNAETTQSAEPEEGEYTPAGE